MASSRCIFCDIYSGKESAKILYRDEEVVVFSDIRPAAKHHYLVVPKEHICNAKHLTKEHIPLVENLVKHGKRVLREKKADIKDTSLNMSYKDWVNCNPRFYRNILQNHSVIIRRLTGHITPPSWVIIGIKN